MSKKNNWPVKKLGEVADFLDNLRKPVTESQRIIGPYPYYGANGQVGWINNYIFNEDLILLAEDGGNFGSKIKPIAYKISGKTWVNNHAHVLRPKNDVDIDWLLFNLMFADVSQFIKGATRAKLNQGDARRIEIPVPGIEEQRRIVKKLEKILAKIEEGKKLREETQSTTQNILYTELGKIFNDGEKKGWKKGGFQDLVDTSDKNAIKPGPFGSSLKKNTYVKSGYKIYGQEQVISGDAYYGDYYIDEKKYKELINFKVSAGDVLISLVGTIGKVLIVPENFEPGIINPRLLKITPDKLKVNARFITYLLKSPLVLNQISQRSHGGTMNILNKGILESLDILMPPISEQKRIVLCLDGLSGKVQALQKLQQEQLQELELLKQSVLHQAFQGEL